MKRVLKMAFAVLLINIIMLSVPFNYTFVFANEIDNTYYFDCGDNLKIEYCVTSQWNNHYNVVVNIKNVSNEVVRNWSFWFDNTDDLYDIYNADYKEGIFCSKEYNQDINPGESVTFGFSAYYESDNIDIPTQFVYCTETRLVDASDYAIEFNILNSYGSYAQGSLIMSNLCEKILKDWTLSFDINCSINYVYNASLCSSDNSIFGISSPSYYPNINVNSEYLICMQLSNIQNNEDVVISNCVLMIYEAGAKDMSSFISGNDGNNTSDVDGENTTDEENENISDDDKGDNGNSNNNQTVSDNIITINLDDYIYNENMDYYQIDSLVSELTGQLLCTEVENMYISIYDLGDNLILYGDISPVTDWTFSDFGLVTGFNYVTVTCELNNGEKIEKTVLISNTYRDNMLNTFVDMNDTDGDGISNYEEEILGLDPDSLDSDNDLILDIEEIALSLTDPLTFDSDKADSDFDGLSDYDERAVYGTEPFEYDTDGDGSCDGNEVFYGLNPLIEDADTGISADLVQSIEEGALVDAGVNITCTAANSEKIFIFPMTSITTDGVIGLPVEYYVPIDFDSAEIWFSYNTDSLDGIDENDLCIAWLDPSINRFVLLDDSVIDTTEHKVSCVVEHFSTYALVNKSIFMKNSVSDITIDVSSIHYDVNNGHSYMVMTTSDGWCQAEAICENYGGHLVTITSQEEQDFIENIMNNESYSRYWIGAYSESNPYEFKWITGEEFLFSNWSVGEPNGYDEFYVEIIKATNYQWNNLPEKYAYTNAFICEWDNDLSGEVINCSSDYIIVDSINYFPVCDSFENQLFSDQPEIEPWTNDRPKYPSGEYIYGLENLYNSMSSDQLAIAGYTWDSLLKSKTSWDIKTALIGGIKIGNYTIGNRVGIFLKHYLNNIGDTQVYTCNHDVFDYDYYRCENILDLLNSCSYLIEEGKSTIIATAPEANKTGTNVKGRYDVLGNQLIYIAFNAFDFSSINASTAVYVAECTKEDDVYYFYMKYYLLDYYDFAPRNYPDLYLFNSNGISKNFVTIGEDSFYGQYDGDNLILY